MQFKNGFYLELTNDSVTGLGEVSFIEGLSLDNLKSINSFLDAVVSRFSLAEPLSMEYFRAYPSVAFGFETAFQDLNTGGKGLLFESDFTLGKKAIPINGLIWMGEKSFMLEQIKDKLREGFRCVKLKVGALDFSTEIELLKYIRTEFSVEDIELRLDANGAFLASEALEKLKILSDLNIHSIEQPIKQGQWEQMAFLCSESPISIALDEELIFCTGEQKKLMLETIRPAYVILKPSMLGGFCACDSWIAMAEELHIGWWATSALESNVGLNAIAQWVATKHTNMVQGLGTGALYKNNTPTRLSIFNGHLAYCS